MKIQVSILVFVELALDGRRYHISRRWRNIELVSILVFVELALDATILFFRGHVPLVSILVFVELALDETCATLTTDITGEFQSLFSWNLLLMIVI